MGKAVSLLVNIKGNTSKAASGSKSTLGGIAKLANTGGYIMALKNISSALLNVTKSQADYIESLNLMQTAFGDSADAATEFVNSLSEASGFDPATITKSLGTFRAMASALGYTSDTADLLATNLTKMQMDLSSLYNMDLSTVSKKLQSAMAGQTEAVRTFGADITEASLQQEAYNRGISKSVSEMTRAEKTLLIYLTLENQLSVANGDAAKTINSVSNQLRVSSDQFTMAARNIGAFFIPVLKSILPILNGILMAFNSIIATVLGLLGIDASSLASEFGTASSGASDLSSSLDDVTDSANKASAAADKSLRSFDKLNNIKTPTSSGSGGSSGVGGGGIDPSILAALKAYDMGEFKSKADEIKQQILDFLDLEKTAGMTAIQTAEYVGTRVAEGLNLITEKINWAEMGKKLATGINVAFQFLVSFVETYDWFKLGQSIATFVNNAIENVNWVNVGKVFFAKWKIVIETLAGFFTTLNYKEIGNAIADFINGAMSMIDVNVLAKGINALVNGIFTAISTAIEKVKWFELASKIMTLLAKLDWKVYLILVPKLIKAFVNFGSTLSDTVIKLKNTYNKFKEAKTVFSDFKTKLSTTEVGVGKFTTSLSKVAGVAGGAALAIGGAAGLGASIKDLATNGANAGNVMGSLAGALSEVGGAAMIGAQFGGVYGAAIGAVVGVVASATEALIIYNQAHDPEKQALEEAREKYEEYKTKIDEANQAYKDAKQSILDNQETNLTELTAIENMSTKLNDYVDSNGKVKAGYEDRVNYILNDLTSATGEEYKLQDGVITKNGEILDSQQKLNQAVQESIEVTKAKIIVDTRRALWEEALKNQIKQEEIYRDTVSDITGKIQVLTEKQQKNGELSKTDKEQLNELIKQGEEAQKNMQTAVDKTAQAEANYDLVSELAGKKKYDQIKTNTTAQLNSNKTLSDDATLNLKKNIEDGNKALEDSEAEHKRKTKEFRDETSKYFNNDIKAKVKVSMDTSGAKTDWNNFVSDLQSKQGKANVQFSLPKKFANGGFPEDGFFFANSRELVGRFDNGKTAVANNEQIQAGIRQAARDGFLDAMQLTGGNNVSVNISAEGDSSGLLNFIRFEEKKQNRQYGL